MRAATFNILSEKIAKNLKRDYYESIVNKDIAFFDTRRTGDLSKCPFLALLSSSTSCGVLI